MGGVVKAISRALGVKKPKAPPVQKAANNVANKAETAKKKAVNAIKGGYGGGTMLTGSGGVTEEANVAKTVLGGASEVMSKKKKNLNATV